MLRQPRGEFWLLLRRTAGLGYGGAGKGIKGQKEGNGFPEPYRAIRAVEMGCFRALGSGGVLGGGTGSGTPGCDQRGPLEVQEEAR